MDFTKEFTTVKVQNLKQLRRKLVKVIDGAGIKECRVRAKSYDLVVDYIYQQNHLKKGSHGHKSHPDHDSHQEFGYNKTFTIYLDNHIR